MYVDLEYTLNYRGLAELVISDAKTANVAFECGWTVLFSVLQLGGFGFVIQITRKC